mmetsp:Transcript_11354/g.23212  ORF Transcript_11354/g.23212 Transcript_11354/m.23212 type:complete len:122 (+) Transcript_11354:418-783(+)
MLYAVKADEMNMKKITRPIVITRSRKSETSAIKEDAVDWRRIEFCLWFLFRKPCHHLMVRWLHQSIQPLISSATVKKKNPAIGIPKMLENMMNILPPWVTGAKLPYPIVLTVVAMNITADQ